MIFLAVLFLLASQAGGTGFHFGLGKAAAKKSAQVIEKAVDQYQKTAQSVPANHLHFLGPTSLNNRACASYKVEAHDSAHAAVPAGSDSVILAQGTTGALYLDFPSCLDEINAVSSATIASSSSSVSFFYRRNTAGAVSLGAQDASGGEVFSDAEPLNITVVSRTFAVVTTNTSPIVLSGTDVLEINDAHYVHRHNITLSDQAQLIIRNSLFEYRHDYSFQYVLNASSGAKVIVEDSEVQSSLWLNWNFNQLASLVLNNVAQSQSDIWHSFMGSATVSAVNSKFKGTINEQVRFVIKNSPEMFVEMVWPVGAVVDEAMPTNVNISSFSFPNANDQSISFQLQIESSSAYGWGITVKPTNQIVIRDARNLVITIAAFYPWTGKTIVLEDLKMAHYDDRTWQVEDSTLRLINSDTWPWSPIVGEDNTLIIRNSQLADNAFSSGHAKIFIEKSTSTFLRAQEFVEMTISTCTITGDVVAKDNGKITLINTAVTGQLKTEGNGQIIQQ